MLSPIHKPCAQPGCRELVITGRCPDHSSQKFIGQRQSAARRGYDRRHQKWRAVILMRDPICKACGNDISTEADHIVPISKGGARFDMSNGQGLDKRCHSMKTSRENAA